MQRCRSDVFPGLVRGSTAWHVRDEVVRVAEATIIHMAKLVMHVDAATRAR